MLERRHDLRSPFLGHRKELPPPTVGVAEEERPYDPDDDSHREDAAIDDVRKPDVRHQRETRVVHRDQRIGNVETTKGQAGDDRNDRPVEVPDR